MGRPTKLTPEVQEKIVNLIRVGNYPEVAAQASGIGRATFYDWMRWAEEGKKPYSDFSDAVKSAQAESESHSVTIIKKAAAGGSWQAAAWYLERSKPERWRRRENVEVTGKDGGPVQQEIVEGMTVRRARELLRELDGDKP